MPEAVIVATARSPIGRAFKGSLTSIRPDDLLAQIVTAALAKVPQLDPAPVEDLIVGCGLPGGEQGFNIARVTAVLLGLDTVPGTTVNRYCSSSLQRTRMAYHAIKAGEGDVFISAGVECVSRFAKGTSDSLPDTQNPLFDAAKARTEATAEAETPWHDPRADGEVPDVYIAMGQTAENVAALRGITRAEQDEFGVRSQNLAEKALANGFWQREITPVTLPDGTVVSADDGPRPGTTLEKIATLKPVFREHGTVTAGNCCPLNDGAAALVVMSDTKAAELGLTPLARIVATGVSALSPEIMGLGPVEASRQALRPGRDGDQRRRPGGDQRGVRGAGHPVLPGAGHRPGAAERERRRDRRRPPVRHDRGADRHHADQQPAVPRQDDRPRDHVRRRRPGHGDDLRAAG